jgi:hypothetical protein
VSALTEPLEPGTFELDVPAEPLELKIGLRDAILGGVAWDELPEPLDLGAWLWGTWGPRLEASGGDRAGFEPILAASRREAWLWLLGDRQWAQFVSGLAGRIVRRLPDPTAI